MEKPRAPRWVPYSPPPPDWKTFVGGAVKRYGFAAACIVLVAGLVGFLWILPGLRLGSTPAGTHRPFSAGEVSAGAPRSPALDTPARSYEGTALLSISTRPAGARVILNRDTAGTTPLNGRRVQAGIYVLSLQKEDHAAIDTVIALEQGQTSRFSFALLQQAGTERTTAEETPEETARELPAPAQENVVASAEGPPEGPPEDRQAAASPPPPPPEPPAQGALHFTSEPSGGAVFVDGRSVGRTPLTLPGLTAGSHGVMIRLDGYQPYHEEALVVSRQRSRVHAELTRRSGTLRVLARPWASIYIDGQLHAENTDLWYAVRLPAGTYRVEVVHPSLGTRQRVVALEGREETSVVFNLNPSTETDDGGIAANDDSAGMKP